MFSTFLVIDVIDAGSAGVRYAIYVLLVVSLTGVVLGSLVTVFAWPRCLILPVVRDKPLIIDKSTVGDCD